jgi:quinohemoprotein amine dehydrogenase
MTAASQVPAPQPAVSLAPGEAPSPAKEDADLGTPVTSPLVLKRCGTCHEADDKSRLTRISYRRTTPEGWESTIRRMVALNGVRLDPAEGREILRYLADHHGLAPEEAAPGAFEVERRLVDYKYEADKDTEDTCIRCHSFGRVLLQRRTANEWTLLMAMHRGFYPYVDFQAFRRMRPAEREPGPDGREPDNRHPMDKAVAHLTRAFPMQTGEWASWAATMRPPDLAGTWVLSGRQPGKGPVYGIVSVTAGAGPGEFASESRLTFAQTGQSEIRKGRSYVYTGFQWRGRSSREGADAQAMREVMAVDRSWNTMNGRWFGGAYDELGIDVTLTRASAGAVVAGVWPRMLKTGQNGQEVKLFGAGLPARLAAGQLNLGQGVTVARVVSAAPTLATIQVDVAADARVGARDLFLSGGTSRATLSVFDTVDSIRVVPQWNMARLGGGENPSFQKGYAQFEAVASSNGLDGQPGTPDDVELGVVDARWSLEEFSATYDDDDIDFVGTIDPETGLFTPNVDGPNPKRRGNTNNFGDVWVVATYAAPGAPATERPLRARAHLLVTVPLYMDWDTPGVVP